ncbi:MAG: glycosyltransferase, partial [Cyanobacteriota bacterium]|nr:glycosyltransferase [Cyanobacteriota bacterium]
KSYLLNLSKEHNLKVFSIWDSHIKEIDHYDIFFLGFQKNPFKYIAKSTVFAFPSLWEGFPNALVEAMICKTPVMASDCKSGPREILAPNTDYHSNPDSVELAKYGVLMPVCDGRFFSAEDPLTMEENIWAEALIKFLNDENLRESYRKSASIRAADFSADRIIGDWLNIINNLSSG